MAERSAVVSREVFAKAVHESKQDGSGIKGIATRTGLKESSVNTRLNNLRKQIGKENVPSFQGGGGNRVTDEEKARLIAILNPPQAVQG